MPDAKRTICDLAKCDKPRWKTSNLCLEHTKKWNADYRAKKNGGASPQIGPSANARKTQDALLPVRAVINAGESPDAPGAPENQQERRWGFGGRKDFGTAPSVEPPCKTIRDAIRRRIEREGQSVNDAPPKLLAQCVPVARSEILKRLERGERVNQ